MTTFAVISDIHGNYSALKEVMSELDRNYQVDHIYSLGDMVGIGLDTNEVLELLFSRNDISMISGNHDEAVLAIIQNKEYPKSHFHIKDHHEKIASDLKPEFIPKLSELPRRICLKFYNYKFLMTHFHIEPGKVNVPIGQDPYTPVKNYHPKTRELKQIFHDYSYYDAMFFGHIHHSYHFHFDNQIYVNPGALGCCKQWPYAPFAIVKVTDSHIYVDLKAVPYDNTKFLKAYEEYRLKGMKGLKQGGVDAP